MSLDHREPAADAFKAAVGSFASGVAVLTVRSREGRSVGMTATAFSSVSTDPLLVLVCVNREARTRNDILSGGSFGVNLLAAGMEEHSRYCASPGADGEPGVPRLRGLPAVPGRHARGDHRPGPSDRDGD